MTFLSLPHTFTMYPVIGSSFNAANLSYPQAPQAPNAPQAPQASQAQLLPHADDGQLALTRHDLATHYPIVPSTIQGKVYMLHPLRYLTPEGSYAFLQHVNSKWPEVQSGYYCLHCFTLQHPAQVCSTPCVNNCGCCGVGHPQQSVSKPDKSDQTITDKHCSLSA